MVNSPKVESQSSLIPVQVAVRVRPLSDKENQEKSTVCLRLDAKENRVIIGKDRSFTYDFVFPPELSQNQLFHDCVEPLLSSCLQGYNSTILAYGQTGSGKTYTMGTNGNKPTDEENVGIIPRVIKTLFERIQSKNTAFQLNVSFLELYNEEIKDMLNPSGDKSLSIREDSMGVFVNNLSEIQVDSEAEVLDALTRGSLSRTVGSTQMNTESSRSHAIFTIILQRVDEQDASNIITSRLHFVDLAGSERLSRTKAEGARMKEGISINGGLLALGNVISALGTAKRKAHIPYRDSKLTRILQDSLGGNSRTLMIACCSPSDTNLEETLNTLKYADRARQIKNKPIVNVDPVKLELILLRKQVLELSRELAKYKESDNNNHSNGSHKVSSFQENFDKLVVDRLEDKIRQKGLENEELNQTIWRNEKKYRILLSKTVDLEEKFVWEGKKTKEEIERSIQSQVSNEIVDQDRDGLNTPPLFSKRMSFSSPLRKSAENLIKEGGLSPLSSPRKMGSLSSGLNLSDLEREQEKVDELLLGASEYSQLVLDHTDINEQVDELLLESSDFDFDLSELMEDNTLGPEFTQQLMDLLQSQGQE
eukprot:TRINITY_DN7284_c0_g1_i1.p1 TRINITY_DN7284_c0_g1~~TRINITY_DN7284_c0_g1_i1.p1  ORF type:complete len:648 (-),score=234.36 TRINITY_DN7284_c0_g1_i1:1817-3595(-)